MLGINMRKLYPEIEPFKRGYLQVSETHRLYYEQVGNPHGKPVVFLHGGPGGGINPEQQTTRLKLFLIASRAQQDRHRLQTWSGKSDQPRPP